MTRAEWRENLLVALDTIRTRKVRSALTILGIVIGVTSVICVAAIIDGLNGYIEQRIRTFGSRTFFVTRIPAGFTGGRLPQKIRMRKYLEIPDAAYIKESVPGVDMSVAFSQRIDYGGTPPDSIQYGGERVDRMILRGTQPDYAAALPLFEVGQGRFISPYDEEHARNVVVIGDGIANTLFPHTDPIGKTVRLNGRLYEVIGVFRKDEGLLSAFGVDIFACIPLSNFHKNYPEIREVFLLFTVREDADLGAVRSQAVDTLRRRRHVPHNAENDFDVTDPDFFLHLWNQVTGALALLTGVIGSIGLLVGGIGVMNIMLISVTERTGEIGLRKAIGARKSDIRAQFLLEATTLSSIGGILGILIGGLISLAVRAVASIPATISPFWVIMGVAIAAGVGLFFGFYPANRAANLDPIVCLRYE
ncbi:MAG TPA: ABC transporter permease [Bryobacteraceae bacterium]|nr:ABC transporter permease [Bryobacteraceae bacterium]